MKTVKVFDNGMTVQKHSCLVNYRIEVELLTDEEEEEGTAVGTSRVAEAYIYRLLEAADRVEEIVLVHEDDTKEIAIAYSGLFLTRIFRIGEH